MTWKKAFVVGLVVLIVVIGMPILMPGMHGGAVCHDCGPAVAAQVCSIFAVLAAALLAIVLVSLRLGRRRDGFVALMLASSFERPPRMA